MKIEPREFLLLPNLISVFRLLLSIPVAILFYLNGSSQAYNNVIIYLLLFGVLTDISDGFIARKTGNVSETGKIIDPLADKVLIAAVLISLFIEKRIPVLFFTSFIVRDLLIFFGGIYVTKRIGRVLPSNLLGKITVIFIGSFLLVLIADLPESHPLYLVFSSMSLLLSVASLIGYFIRAKEYITKNAV
jgi:CDP-diacylglycerol--glycerol-3-phosphate 3-phosphatidyltransferase